MNPRCILISVVVCSLITVPVRANAAATIVVQNADSPGVGFSDTTAATPVGDNAGITVGQQRLIVLKYAALVWGMSLSSSVPVTVNAQFKPLTCQVDRGVLASAGPAYVLSNSPNFRFPQAWYPGALGNALNSNDANPGNASINANFNSDSGTTNCLPSASWYYGLDGNTPQNQLDMVTIALHELAHGFGFSTTTDGSTGMWGPPSSPRDNVFDHFLFDLTANLHWPDMTNSQRMASAINTRKLAWDGPNSTARVPSVLQPGTPTLTVTSPTAADLVIGLAAFGPQLSSPGVSGMLQRPATDQYACQSLPVGSLAGKVALIDRGPSANPCTFVVKVKNAQTAGAIAAVVVNNAAGSPPPNMGGSDPTITIPSVHVTQSDGTSLETTGGSVTLHTLPNVYAGADPSQHPLLYTPNPFLAGSSIPHNDTISNPHLLMEPDYSTNLGHSLDLTPYFLQDIGWTVSNPNPPATSADIAISVTGAGSHGGGTASWTVKVNNIGPSDAADVEVFNTPPAGISFSSNSGDCTGNSFPCVLGTIPALGSKTFTASFNVPSTYPANSISNTFNAVSPVPDPNTSNNSASANSTSGGGGCSSTGTGWSALAAIAAMSLVFARRRGRVRA